MEGTVMSITEDVQLRSAHIHWPQGIVPEEYLFWDSATFRGQLGLS
jgi:hypothetical protein